MGKLKSCSKVSFLTGTGCQFLCVCPGMKQYYSAVFVVSFFQVQFDRCDQYNYFARFDELPAHRLCKIVFMEIKNSEKW